MGKLPTSLLVYLLIHSHIFHLTFIRIKYCHLKSLVLFHFPFKPIFCTKIWNNSKFWYVNKDARKSKHDIYDLSYKLIHSMIKCSFRNTPVTSNHKLQKTELYYFIIHSKAALQKQCFDLSFDWLNKSNWTLPLVDAKKQQCTIKYLHRDHTKLKSFL